ncbi:uncharacterized protein EV154DRAFT_476534 [Mucor mucedo]|uniref:uncharacterized protein n=1 Tax=Mucor mucedo TaxID=29922 RepID=UPI00221F0D33|nr:uncharacterized protein EV154DRAFT_476534 [Mucor mucedo]KAI7896517.1 hypothetical protein EV154DRAFT_476534 [Mucor mucedo]
MRGYSDIWCALIKKPYPNCVQRLHGSPKNILCENMPKLTLGILGLHKMMTVPVERQKINRSFYALTMQPKEASCLMQSALASNQENGKHLVSFASDQTGDMELERRIRQQDSPYFKVSAGNTTPCNVRSASNKDQTDQEDSKATDVNDSTHNKNIELKLGHDKSRPLNISREFGHYRRYLTMASGRTLIIQVHPDVTVDDLKKHIQVREAVPANTQQIIYAGKQLLDGHTITHYNVHAGSTLHLSHYLRGGSTETIPKLIDLYISSRYEYPHINEFIDLNKYVLFNIGWDPRPNWHALKQEYNTYFKSRELDTADSEEEDTSD